MSNDVKKSRKNFINSRKIPIQKNNKFENNRSFEIVLKKIHNEDYVVILRVVKINELRINLVALAGKFHHFFDQIFA